MQHKCQEYGAMQYQEGLRRGEVVALRVGTLSSRVTATGRAFTNDENCSWEGLCVALRAGLSAMLKPLRAFTHAGFHP